MTLDDVISQDSQLTSEDSGTVTSQDLTEQSRNNPQPSKTGPQESTDTVTTTTCVHPQVEVELEHAQNSNRQVTEQLLSRYDESS